MKLRIERKGLLKLMTVGLLFAGLASAGTIVANGIDGTRGGSLWLKEGTHEFEALAGVIFITLTDEDDNQFSRDTFCADIATNIFLGVAYGSNVLRPDQVQGRNLNRAAWLVDNALLPTQGPVYTSQLDQENWVTTRVQGIGLQFAIWDITSDGGDGFDAGLVQKSTYTDPAVLAWAQNYVAWSLGMSSNLAFVYDNVDMGNNQPAQMLVGPMFLDGGPAPEPVPEPSTLVLAGAAMIAIGVSVRRKNRLKQAA